MSPRDASPGRATSGRAFALVFAAAFAIVAGCSGKVIDHGGVPDQGSCGPHPPTTSCASCTCEGTQWVCAPVPNCTPEAGACVDGQTRPAGDGCNTCTCSSGQWLCTDLACVTLSCNPGDERAAGDGCNVCACDDNGTWDCSQKACPPPPTLDASTTAVCGGLTGRVCLDGQYCAYSAGEYCGGGDQSSHCQPRPGSCTEQNDPVCGCDLKTYANACLAAQAGYGVYATGPCESPAQSPCDQSDPQGRGQAVVAGCPCSVIPGDYCCNDSSGTGYACNNRAWARFFDGRCGGIAPDAGISAPVAGTITCGP